MKRTIAIIALITILMPTLSLAAKYQAEVAVAWKGSGTHEDPYTPNWGAFTVDKYEDTTGQPGENIVPSPNSFIALIECDNVTLDSMVGAGFIELWREKIVEPVGPGSSLHDLWNTMSDFLLPSAYAQSTSASASANGNGNEKPKKAVMKKLKQDLKAKGIKDADLDKTELKDVNKDSTKTRKEISEELRSVMRTFPKAR